MNEQLLLKNIRQVLVRLEETIIFALIERSQFRRNAIVYQAGAFGASVGSDSLAGFLLHQTEQIHACMRRYTSPDEHPFYAGLPAPLLPELVYRENPLRPNSVNLNGLVRRQYEARVVPLLCEPGDDRQYGSTAVCDVACLQALSKRIHYGKFVAESKYRQQPQEYERLAAAGDRQGLAAAITDRAVEAGVLERVGRKARNYTGELAGEGWAQGFPEAILEIYREVIIPLTKEVEVDYLVGLEVAGG